MKWKPGMTEQENEEYNRRRRARYAAKRYKAWKGYSPQNSGATIRTASAAKPISQEALDALAIKLIAIDEREE